MRVALVGYPNVGKSSLFNRLLGRREAIVDPLPGVTRDRKEGRCRWAEVTLIDTGGIDPEEQGGLAEAVREQALAAVQEADLVALVVDGRAGPQAVDMELVRLLQTSGKPVLVLANKCERPADRLAAEEFRRLGLGEVIAVSATQGDGIAELKERLASLASPRQEEEEEGEALPIAVLGRPNVGKSSLVNRLLGYSRMVVGERGGTTRDAVTVPLSFQGRQLLLVDTAGVRRRAKQRERLERAAAGRTRRAAEGAAVALVVCDAAEGVTSQDLRVCELASAAGCGTVVVLNKIDAYPSGKGRTLASDKAFVEGRVRERPPVVFTSALTGEGVEDALAAALAVGAAVGERIPTPALNRAVEEAVLRRPAPLVAKARRRLRIYYASQLQTGPPRIGLWVNDPQLARREYLQYLENRIREQFNLKGVPILFELRPRRAVRSRGSGKLPGPASTPG